MPSEKKKRSEKGEQVSDDMIKNIGAIGGKKEEGQERQIQCGSHGAPGQTVHEARQRGVGTIIECLAAGNEESLGDETAIIQIVGYRYVGMVAQDQEGQEVEEKANGNDPG